MKKQFITETARMQKLAGIQLNEAGYVTSVNSYRMLKLIEMYVDNYYDEGMSAEAALNKIDELLQGQLEDYDKAFMAGEEDNY
jgi:hypothetical protein